MSGRTSSSDDEPLPELFRGVARRLRYLTQESLAPWDVSPSQFRALGVLGRHGSMRLSDLSDHLRIAARSATEVVDALSDRGLVVRAPDPADRRAVIVALSDRGQELLTSVRATRADHADRYFGSLTAAEQAELAELLRKLPQ